MKFTPVTQRIHAFVVLFWPTNKLDVGFGNVPFIKLSSSACWQLLREVQDDGLKFSRASKSKKSILTLQYRLVMMEGEKRDQREERRKRSDVTESSSHFFSGCSVKICSVFDYWLVPGLFWEIRGQFTSEKTKLVADLLTINIQKAQSC